MRELTREEVAKHNKEGDLWTIIDTSVYDMSDFTDLHPGGAQVLLDLSVAGKDSTKSFFGLHRSEVLKKYHRLKIGTIRGEKSKYILPVDGANSSVPYGEPLYLRPGFSNPYYKKSHYDLQKAARLFFDENIREEAMEHEKSGERPTVELVKKMGQPGIELNAMRLGPGKHLHGRKLLGGVKGEEFDSFHELILSQEVARLGARGYYDGLGAGMWIGLTPLINYECGHADREVVPKVLAGDKFICLAISEAFAGSDVASMRTTATKTADGKHYIINGTKKWITNGTFADYFSVGCRTGKDQLSLILVPRQEGLETKPIKTSYSAAAGTAYVTFDNVKVPVENLIGKEGDGLKIILSNFNHERWNMVVITARWSRFITEESFKWAHQREVFGKPLIDQPVIRAKFGRMFATCEAVQSWLETITHQMCTMTYQQQAQLLAGPIGLLKYYSTRVIHDVVDDAVQIFGGRALTQSNMGKFIEIAQRTYKFDAILGGSEEILADLGVKQARKSMPLAVL